MIRTSYSLAVFLLIASPAAAQSRFYAGAAVASDAGGRGPVDVGTFPAAGALIGWHFAEGWSVEFHVDRGFGEGDPRTLEGLLLARSGTTQEERERTGVFGRSTWQDQPGPGWAALAVYTARASSRADVSVYAGVSERRFRTRHTTTITHVGPDAGYPSDHPNVQDRDEKLTRRGGGVTGGFMVPIRIAGQVSVAPELRLTLGLITDESTYKQLYSGVRVMFGK